MNIILFGSKGYMAGHILKLYPDAHCPSVDIADSVAVSQVLDDLKPDAIINCAGKTGRPNVDWCEEHKEETVRSNVTGPLVLLEETQKRDIYFVQMGSGCIYQGDNGGEGFSEEDIPNFTGSFYARTKGWIDQILKDFPVLQLRIRMPFDSSDHPRNLINKLKKYNRILDAQNSISCTPDVLSALDKLVQKRATGIYNMVNPGGISPYEVMNMYKKIVQEDYHCEKIIEDQLSEVVTAGRSNCILSTTKLEQEGITMRPVEEAMENCLREIAESST